MGIGLRRLARRVRYAGNRHECPICGGRFSRFAEQRPGVPFLCPRCGSLPRHRLLWLYLRELGVLERPRLDVLHVSPEPGIESRLRALPGVRYVSVDLHDPGVSVRADLTDLPFLDRSFDLVLCSHVLEHVPDDRRAMRELQRVLRRDGLAIVQSPVNYDQASGTHEDPRLTDEDERLRLFSQRDHVRVYGPDLRERLAQAGFVVSVEMPGERLSAETTVRYGLTQSMPPLRNDLYCCTK